MAEKIQSSCGWSAVPTCLMRIARSVLNNGAIATWAQTVIAAIALYFAFTTLNSWKEQELAKRQAEVSSVLLMKLNSLSSTVSAMRPEAIKYDVSNLLGQDSILRQIYGNPLYFQFITQAKEFKSYGGVVSGTIDNEPLRVSIADLVSDTEALANCVQHLRELDRAPDAEKTGGIWQRRAMSALAAFSMLPAGQTVKRNQNPCSFGFDDIADNIERVEKRSADYLRFTANADSARKYGPAP